MINMKKARTSYCVDIYPTLPIIISIIFITFISTSSSQTDEVLKAALPPSLLVTPPADVAFRTFEGVKLPCQATGQPPPSYHWMKDGKRLEVDGLSMQLYPGEGSLHFKMPQESDHGIYQCYATNEYGTAVSHKINFTRAVLHTFPTPGLEPTVERVKVGESLKLSCQPPYSNPPATVYWGHNRNNSKLMPLPNDQRVSLDHDGNLYFANVEEADERDGENYVCIADNKVLRILVQGNDIKIKTRNQEGLKRAKGPRLMWKSGNVVSAINGHFKKIKCIFSGFPTPRVTWQQASGEPLPPHVHPMGQELHFINVSHNDEGVYNCIASVAGVHKTASESINLVVDAVPRWRSRGLEDIVTSEDEDAAFSCTVLGSPKPAIHWFINGEPVEELDLESMRGKVEGQWLKFHKVRKEDFRVVQCLAHNMYGSLFKNAYLKILAEEPQIVESAGVVRVAVGQTAVLKCAFTGAPKPHNRWYRGEVEDGSDVDLGGKYDLEGERDLRINDAQAQDSGEYVCFVKNKFGNKTAVGELVVLNQTKILTKPKDQVVVKGASVTFECLADTDERVLSSLTTQWLFEKRDLTEMGKSYRTRHLFNHTSFTISNAQVADTGSYSCVASNDIDRDEASFKLIVKDRPEAPYNVKVECHSGNAEVSWSAGDDNNQATTHFTVFYNSSNDDPGDYTTGCVVSSDKHDCLVDLYPWSNFTFHVVANNSLGSSDKSHFSLTTCATKPRHPYKHPELVCSVSREPGTLVIIWKPMEKKEHNGPNFHYLISYRKHGKQFHNSDEEPANFTKAIMNDWRQNEIVVKQQGIFQAYEVSVEAVNDEGPADERPKRVVAFSSQDVPLEAPSNLNYVQDTLSSTSATFVFVGVENDQEKLRGYFVGYELKYWREGDEKSAQTKRLILQEFKPCHDLPDSQKWKRSAFGEDNVQEISVDDLWPYTSIQAGVAVINGAKASRLSNIVTLVTPEGVPDDITEASVVESGSHHIKIVWRPPKKINGMFDAYMISIREKGNHDSHSEAVVLDFEQHYKKLHGLKSESEYEVEIRVKNGLHTSSNPFQLTARTVPEAEPDMPSIEAIQSGFDFANITWSSSKGKPLNPGKNYVVEYKKPGDAFWSETVSEDEHNWMNVSSLQHGVPYEFRVVAFNHHGEKMVSEALVHVIGAKPEPVSHKASMLSWLVPLVLLFLLFLLLLLILIFYLCKRRSQTGHYRVSVKEQKLGLKYDEEATFDEYLRSENSTFRKGKQGSLEGSLKSSSGDGSDSLGAYDDVDPSKFNDEGSFVDQSLANGSLPNGGVPENLALMDFKMAAEA